MTIDYVTIRTSEFDLDSDANFHSVNHYVLGLGYHIHTVLKVDGYYCWLLEKES